MNIYKYKIDAKSVNIKYELLYFITNEFYFQNISEEDEEHKTKYLYLCIKSMFEPEMEIIEKYLYLINWIYSFFNLKHKNIELINNKYIQHNNINIEKDINIKGEDNLKLSLIYKKILWNKEYEEIFIILWNWITFYNIYKITDIFHSMWIKESPEIKLIKHTANSTAIWLESRHWWIKNKPPKNPISLDESFMVIKNVIINELGIKKEKDIDEKYNLYQETSKWKI